MIDVIIGSDVRLIGTRTPVMKVHRHLDGPDHIECIWFNTLLELQTGIFSTIVLEENKHEGTHIKGDFPE